MDLFEFAADASAAQMDSEFWLRADQLLATQDKGEQITSWERILDLVSKKPVSKGHVYFRLAILHLRQDEKEDVALDLLMKAYAEDQRYEMETGRFARRMSAYRLLVLLKDYFIYLSQEVRQKTWQSTLLQRPHREHQIETLLFVFDRSLVHPLDAATHTYQSFFKLMKDKQFTRFAIENYFCADELITDLFLERQHAFRQQHEYPIARALIVLIAGVLEAILADRFQEVKRPMLGELMSYACSNNKIPVSSRLAILASIMLFLRNHIHPDRDAKRTEYFLDINAARGCKAALDVTISEMLSQTV